MYPTVETHSQCLQCFISLQALRQDVCPIWCDSVGCDVYGVYQVIVSNAVGHR